MDRDTKEAISKFAKGREMTVEEATIHLVKVGLTRLAATAKYAKASKPKSKAKAKAKAAKPKSKAKARKAKAKAAKPVVILKARKPRTIKVDLPAKSVEGAASDA